MDSLGWALCHHARTGGCEMSSARLAVAAEDLSRFASDKHFASWLGLCPGTRISGGKVLGDPTLKMDGGAVFKIAVRVLDSGGDGGFHGNAAALRLRG